MGNVSWLSRQSIEEKNPLKQGLKLKFCQDKFSIITIEEKNPLKQGLKQGFWMLSNLTV